MYPKLRTAIISKEHWRPRDNPPAFRVTRFTDSEVDALSKELGALGIEHVITVFRDKRKVLTVEPADFSDFISKVIAYSIYLQNE